MKRSRVNEDHNDSDEDVPSSSTSSFFSEWRKKVSSTDHGSFGDYCIGIMERGHGLAFTGLERFDEPSPGSSYCWWGTLLVTKIDDYQTFCRAIAHDSHRLSIVDNVDSSSFLLKLNTSSVPMMINYGLTPCITSQAESESLSCTKEDKEDDRSPLYHMQYMVDRGYLHKEVDYLYESTYSPSIRVYVVLCVHPLKLAYIPRKPMGV